METRMKHVVIAVMIAALAAVPGFSGAEDASIKAVKVEKLEIGRTLDDEALNSIAYGELSRRNDLFAETANFDIQSQSCSISDGKTMTLSDDLIELSVAVRDEDKYNLFSLPDHEEPTRTFDLAIVHPDGTVDRIQAGADEEEGAFSSQECLLVEDGAVVLAFVEGVNEDIEDASQGITLGLAPSTPTNTPEYPGDPGDSGHPGKPGKDKGNHGHGNNVDGIDGDNPGKGQGGPNRDKDGNDGDDETNPGPGTDSGHGNRGTDEGDDSRGGHGSGNDGGSSGGNDGGSSGRGSGNGGGIGNGSGHGNGRGGRSGRDSSR